MLGRRLENKVVVVTGASSGVGRAIARAFGQESAKVALIARGVEGLQNAARELRAYGTEALVLPLDVSDARAVDEAARRVVDTWGGIDIWVNDAMVSVFSPVWEMSAQEFRRVTEVNYLGYVHGTLAALRYMLPKDSGVVVQIGSALAYRSIPLQSAYCASKAAIRGFSDSLRSELIRYRSRVAITMLQLPAVNTPQFEVVRNRLTKHPQPVPPIYQPEVIAHAVVRAALHPKREKWISWTTVKVILGQRLFPGFLDRYLAEHAWEAQQTDDLPSGHARRHTSDNVDVPLPGDRGARGPFNARARTKLWVWTGAGWFAALVALIAASLFLAGYAPGWSSQQLPSDGLRGQAVQLEQELFYIGSLDVMFLGELSRFLECAERSVQLLDFGTLVRQQVDADLRKQAHAVFGSDVLRKRG